MKTIWQFPQFLLGLILIRIYKAQLLMRYKECNVYISEKISGAISLSRIIITDKYVDDHRLAHEYGHYKQSLLLGWLYLLVIGIPSYMWSLYCIKQKKKPDYYSFWTEKWADHLGGVRR